MPYARPTLTELRQQALQDVLDGGIPNVSAVLRFSVLTVLSYVLAGLAYLHYGYLDWIAKQAVPWTATDEYLAGWGGLKDVVIKEATSASGSVAFTATGSGVINAGTSIALAGGLLAVTTADSTLNGTTVTAPATCSETGIAGNVPAGTRATLSSPVPGIQTVGQVTTAFTGGADTETADDFRARVLLAWQGDAANGRKQDYINWALAVPGVTRAWCNPLGFGAGTIVVYPMFDDAESAYGGFPQGTDGASSSDTRYATATGDQLTVANALYELQPVDALVIVCSPKAQPVNFVVADLGTGNTVSNQTLITAALQDMFLRLSAPGGTIHPNDWEEAIAAIGLSTFSVPQPAESVTGATADAMPTLGTLTFEN